MTLTDWLTRKHEAAAESWFRAQSIAQARWVHTPTERRARRRLRLWDALLAVTLTRYR